jgi:hypothetical protein
MAKSHFLREGSRDHERFVAESSERRKNVLSYYTVVTEAGHTTAGHHRRSPFDCQIMASACSRQSGLDSATKSEPAGRRSSILFATSRPLTRRKSRGSYFLPNGETEHRVPPPHSEATGPSKKRFHANQDSLRLWQFTSQFSLTIFLIKIKCSCFSRTSRSRAASCSCSRTVPDQSAWMLGKRMTPPTKHMG